MDPTLKPKKSELKNLYLINHVGMSVSIDYYSLKFSS